MSNLQRPSTTVNNQYTSPYVSTTTQNRPTYSNPYSGSSYTQPTTNTNTQSTSPYSYNYSTTTSYTSPYVQNRPTYQVPTTQYQYTQPSQQYGQQYTTQQLQKPSGYSTPSNQQTYSQPNYSTTTNYQTNLSKPLVQQQQVIQTQPIQQQTFIDPNLLGKSKQDLTRDEIDTISKAGKELFTNAFSKSSTDNSVEDIISQLKSTGQKYKDLEFPPTLKSLTGGIDEIDLIADGSCVEWSKIIWLRADDFMGKGKYDIFRDKIEPDDISQGSLGDCYFLSTLASLAENEDRIRRLFITDHVNDQGVYAVKVCDRGEWRTIIIDDFFPCDPKTKQPVFTSGHGSELWVLILEKVWAKVYGGYAKIEAGLTRECLHDLTAGPTKYFLTSNTKVREQMWTELLQGEKSKFVMTAGSGDNDAGADLLGSTGLVGSHAYSLLSCAEVTDKTGKQRRLVKLRNPWGQGEWSGEWSDGHACWTPELKKQLGIDGKDDGNFWMSFEDLCEFFTDAQICRVHDDYKYVSVKATGVPRHAVYFKVTIKKDGHYYLTANQESRRKFWPPDEYNYSELDIVFGKKEGDRIEYIEGLARADKEVWTEGEMKAGEYIVYVKCDWNDKKAHDFSLGIYGASEATVEKVPKSYCPDFLDRVYMSKGRINAKAQDYAFAGVATCKRAIELTDDGFGYVYWNNQSNKTLEEELYFKTFDGLRFRKPFRGTTIKVVVKPGEEKIAITKIIPGAKSFKQGFTEKSKFT